MKTIPIHGAYITLGQFLKVTDCISSGGEAKAFLQDADIRVNGAPENRRGRKLVPGDRIVIKGSGEFLVAEQA